MDIKDQGIKTLIQYSQEKRREEALEKQREAREERGWIHRNLALKELRESKLEKEKNLEVEFERSLNISPNEKQNNNFNLMYPEWLIECPKDLKENWYVMPKPEGLRCLVMTNGYSTTAKDKYGAIIDEFQSKLPGGSRRNLKGYKCIIDCVFSEKTQIYNVIDILMWNDLDLRGCPVDFRMLWKREKINECNANDDVEKNHKYKFEIVPYFVCNEEGLELSIKCCDVSFEKDGLFFYHKDSIYISGVSDLFLAWKDDCCSKYVINTDVEGKISPFQIVILKLDENGDLVTNDEKAIKLAQLMECDSIDIKLLDESYLKLKIGKLFKFELRNLNVTEQGSIMAELKYIGIYKHKKRGADSMSRILFQYHARYHPIKYHHILDELKRQN